MRRRILVLATWFPDDASPLNGIFVRDQALALSTKYDVAVLAPRLVSFRDTLRRRVGRGAETEYSGALQVYRERALSFLPRSLVVAYYSYWRAVKRGFERTVVTFGKPDIIHAHVVLPGGWAAVKLGKTYSIPVVLTEHSCPFYMHLGTEYQRRLVRATLTEADHVVAVSPALARQMNAFEESVAITVIGNLIRTQLFVPQEDVRGETCNGVTRFLSVAILREHKGLVHLLEAARLLTRRGIKSFEIVIGGDGPDRARIEQLAHGLGVAHLCRFLGSLTPDQVRDQMQKCSVFVLPSLRETFGIVLGEAMACGKPVISTRCGGPEFVVTEDTGTLVGVGDSTALADAMEAFVVGRTAYNARLIRQSVVDRFGEEAFVRNISAVYEQVWSQR